MALHKYISRSCADYYGDLKTKLGEYAVLVENYNTTIKSNYLDNPEVDEALRGAVFLQSIHRIYEVIQQQEIVEDAAGQMLSTISGSYTESTNDSESNVLKSTNLYQKFGNLSNISDPVLTSTNIQWDSEEFEKRTTITYDASGKPQSVQKTEDVPTMYVYGYNDQFPIAQVINATMDQIAYTGFEDDYDFTNPPISRFQLPDPPPGLADCQTVYTNCITNDDDPDNPDCEQQFSQCVADLSMFSNISKAGEQSFSGVLEWNGPIGDYIFSAWVFGTGELVLNGTSHLIDAPDWQYFEIRLDNISAIRIDASQMYIDETRIHPPDARMTTFTYHLAYGVTSKNDPNNVVTKYRYGPKGRLKYIYDHRDNIVQKFDYEFVTNE